MNHRTLRIITKTHKEHINMSRDFSARDINVIIRNLCNNWCNNIIYIFDIFFIYTCPLDTH